MNAIQNYGAGIAPEQCVSSALRGLGVARLRRPRVCRAGIGARLQRRAASPAACAMPRICRGERVCSGFSNPALVQRRNVAQLQQLRVPQRGRRQGQRLSG